MKTLINFWTKTSADFKKVEKPEGIKPFATSPRGSEYYVGQDEGGVFVIRYADHWGLIDNGCTWLLDTDDCYNTWAYGKCYLKDFIDSEVRDVFVRFDHEFNGLRCMEINNKWLMLDPINTNKIDLSKYSGTSSFAIQNEVLILEYTKLYFKGQFVDDFVTGVVLESSKLT